MSLYPPILPLLLSLSLYLPPPSLRAAHVLPPLPAYYPPTTDVSMWLSRHAQTYSLVLCSIVHIALDVLLIYLV